MRHVAPSLVALLCLACAGPRASAPPKPDPNVATPLEPALRAAERGEKDATQNSLECQSDAVRFSERACALRGNRGVFARRCIDGRWRQTEECRCSGVVNVPDSRLRERIAAELTIEGPLEAERVAGVLSLDLKSTAIESLEGLECFHGLEKLVLWKHHVEDLSPLGELTFLSELTATNGRVRDLSPLASLSKLEKLSLSSNRIVTLAPLHSLTGLTSLSIGENCVTDLSPVQGMPKLRHISASFNYVEALTPLGAMPQIEVLILSGNYFADLAPLSNLYELRVLFVDSNGLSDISALTELRRFDLINVQRNRIDCDAQAESIRKMEEHAKLHGGEVFHDCGPKARQARRMGIRDPLSQPVIRNKARDPRCARDDVSKR